MPGSKSETLGDLQRFMEAMSANATELPQCEMSRVTCQGLLGRAQTLTQQQAALTASKQDSTRQLQDVLNEVQRLATVLRFAVRQHYGIDSEKLAEFGLQPYRGRPRKKQPETPPGPEAPAPAVVPDLTGL